MLYSTHHVIANAVPGQNPINVYNNIHIQVGYSEKIDGSLADLGTISSLKNIRLEVNKGRIKKDMILDDTDREEREREGGVGGLEMIPILIFLVKNFHHLISLLFDYSEAFVKIQNSTLKCVCSAPHYYEQLV